jgi:tRNA uridine 5-carboxymethylaminomethyl modification enzyme
MLNKSKGPAMWSPRVQSDRMRLPKNGGMMLEVRRILILSRNGEWIDNENGVVKGVKLLWVLKFVLNRLLLTNGTF